MRLLKINWKMRHKERKWIVLMFHWIFPLFLYWKLSAKQNCNFWKIDRKTMPSGKIVKEIMNAMQIQHCLFVCCILSSEAPSSKIKLWNRKKSAATNEWHKSWGRPCFQSRCGRVILKNFVFVFYCVCI